MPLFNKKFYKIYTIKNYLKKSNFLFFFSGLNKNSKNNLFEKKKFKSLKLYYKINNKITIKLIKNSLKYFISFLINGSLFLIKFSNNKILIKSVLIMQFYFLFPIVLALKLNNKIYGFTSIDRIYSLSYFQNKQLIKEICNLKLKSYNFFFKLGGKKDLYSRSKI